MSAQDPALALPTRSEFYMTGVIPMAPLTSQSAPPEDCIICFDPLDANVVQIQPCQHLFHAQCVQKWFEHNDRNCRCKNRACPTCRVELYRPNPHSHTTASVLVDADLVPAQESITEDAVPHTSHPAVAASAALQAIFGFVADLAELDPAHRERLVQEFRSEEVGPLHARVQRTIQEVRNGVASSQIPADTNQESHASPPRDEASVAVHAAGEGPQEHIQTLRPEPPSPARELDTSQTDAESERSRTPTQIPTTPRSSRRGSPRPGVSRHFQHARERSSGMSTKSRNIRGTSVPSLSATAARNEPNVAMARPPRNSCLVRALPVGPDARGASARASSVPITMEHEAAKETVDNRGRRGL